MKLRPMFDFDPACPRRSFKTSSTIAPSSESYREALKDEQRWGCDGRKVGWDGLSLDDSRVGINGPP